MKGARDYETETYLRHCTNRTSANDDSMRMSSVSVVTDTDADTDTDTDADTDRRLRR
jgi:hypothetical protein